MSASPHPQFFILRPDGTKTPLIAVDELPLNFHVQGAPPSISDAQTQGLVSLGLVKSSGRYYVVQHDEDSPTSSASLGPSSQSDSDRQGARLPRKYTAPDAGLGRIESLSPAQSVLDNSQKRSGSSSTSKSSDTPSRTKWCHAEPGVDETQAIIDAVTRVSSQTATQQVQRTAAQPAAGCSQPARGKKIYCIYWLRKGECDYLQQGCLYKHEMPPDKATLASLGFREVPRWYREQVAAGAPSARMQREDHVNHPWRAHTFTPSFSSAQPDAPRALSPLSTSNGATQIRQLRLVSSTSPPGSAIGARKGFEMSKQRQNFKSNGTISSTTPSRNGSNVSRLEGSRQTNTAQPVRPGSIAPNTPITPTRASGKCQPAPHRPGNPHRHQPERAVSPDQLLAEVPIILPSHTPVQGQPTTPQGPRHVLPTATVYSGMERTASPAHPRLFVKHGQEKFALNPSVEVVERSKTLVKHAESKPSKTLDIFGNLGT